MVGGVAHGCFHTSQVESLAGREGSKKKMLAHEKWDRGKKKKLEQGVEFTLHLHGKWE